MPPLDISYKWSHKICSLMLLLFHLEKCFQGWSMYQYSIIFYSCIIFLCTMIYIYKIYPFISWWTFEFSLHFGAIWIMLLWTFVDKFLCRPIFLFINTLGVYLVMELQGHMVILFNHLRTCQIIFQSGCAILHSHQNMFLKRARNILWH